MTDQPDPPGSNIAELRPPISAAPIQIERLERSCFRHPLVIDDLADKVWCRICKREVAPLEALKQLAQEWDLHKGWISGLIDERSRLAAEVEDLKRQRTNLRAQVKRLERKI